LLFSWSDPLPGFARILQHLRVVIGRRLAGIGGVVEAGTDDDSASRACAGVPISFSDAKQPPAKGGHRRGIAILRARPKAC
jgi:hypothetical protein